MNSVFFREQLHLSINDFGIETLSLLALQEFKMDSVKIDRELIKDAGQGGDAARILEAIIAMAHAKNVQVIGMGVEKEEQLQFFSQAGCDYEARVDDGTVDALMANGWEIDRLS